MSENGGAADGDAKGYGGTAKGTGVHEDEAAEAIWVEGCAPHADGATPVMSEEGDILELEELDQLSEAVYVSLEGVEGRLLGFF